MGMPTQEFVEGVTLIFIHTTKYMSNTEIYIAMLVDENDRSMKEEPNIREYVI
jgi:hypothetical protein